MSHVWKKCPRCGQKMTDPACKNAAGIPFCSSDCCSDYDNGTPHRTTKKCAFCRLESPPSTIYYEDEAGLLFCSEGCRDRFALSPEDPFTAKRYSYNDVKKFLCEGCEAGGNEISDGGDYYHIFMSTRHRCNANEWRKTVGAKIVAEEDQNNG